MDKDLVDHLKSLHTGAVDARNGYERALEDADKAQDLRTLFRELIAIHQRHDAELADVLAKAGEKPDESGSFMSTIHRTIMDIRSFFGGLGASVLGGLIDGETRNLHAYDAALKHAGGDAGTAALLTEQRGRLAEVIAKMERLKTKS